MILGERRIRTRLMNRDDNGMFPYFGEMVEFEHFVDKDGNQFGVVNGEIFQSIVVEPVISGGFSVG